MARFDPEAAPAWARRLLLVGLAVVVGVVNLRLYTTEAIPADSDRVVSHLRFLESSIDDGLAPRMQQQFPEGYFFTHVLYGLTWVELGLAAGADDDLRTEALDEARAALVALDTPAGRAPFSPDLDPAHGVFYVGWSNYLRAGVVALQVRGMGLDADDEELVALGRECDAVVDALERDGGSFLASYPGQVWPVDTYPAMVSIKGCAEFVDPGYQQVVDGWLLEVDAERHPVYGLVGHRTEPFTEHPRATSQTLILRFLAELDPERAALTYRRFRDEFVVSFLGLPAVREHPHDIDAGGDVDSGPLVAGVSASASVVAVAAAQANGDADLARALRREGRAFGVQLPLPGGARYVGGLLPIGDLFVVWASSAHLWFQPESPPIDAGPGWAWRLPTQAVSLVFCLLAWFVVWPGMRARTRRLSAGLSVARRADDRAEGNETGH